MGLTASAALWFAPLVLPICFLVAWNDMAHMKIPNVMVMTLVGVYVVIGLLALPLSVYLWGFAYLVGALLVGIVLNYAGAMGAGDAKFIAAAAPFVQISDLKLILLIFCASLLGAFAAHRLAKYTPLHRLVPDWKSWGTGARFPMGLALGSTLAIYLILGIFLGGNAV